MYTIQKIYTHHCLVIDNSIQCTFPSMTGYNFCMFHIKIIQIRNTLPTLYDYVIQKLEEGIEIGTIHISHNLYNWSDNSIHKSAIRLKENYGLSCKINKTNTMIYMPRFQTKDDLIAHRYNSKEIWRQHNMEDADIEIVIVILIIAVIIGICMSLDKCF